MAGSLILSTAHMPIARSSIRKRTSHLNPYEMNSRMLIATSSGGHTNQSLEDKLNALRYFLSGQGISFVVLKATTSELIGPKRKHLNYLLTMSNQPNVSIPSMVKHLIMRSRHPDWPVAFKSLITIHHLITYGHENFLQNFASSIVNSTAIDSLCSFIDQTTTLAHNMSIYLRRYARYLSSKIQAYRSLGHDHCRARANIDMREMPLERLLQTLPMIQEQFDTLLAFDASIDDLCNGIINSAFIMLYNDFVKLYIVYQAAIIRLLGLFFASDNPKEAREMFNLYKKFLVRMDKVSDFMPVVDSVGLDKSSMPNLTRVPSAPLAVLENHLNQLGSVSKRLYERSLGRLEYGTLGRPRRRSIRTPTRHSSIDILSPMAVKSYIKRNEELKRLDRMVSLDGTGYGNSNGYGAQINNVIEESIDETQTIRSNVYEEIDGIYGPAGSTINEPIKFGAGGGVGGGSVSRVTKKGSQSSDLIKLQASEEEEEVEVKDKDEDEKMRDGGTGGLGEKHKRDKTGVFDSAGVSNTHSNYNNNCITDNDEDEADALTSWVRV